MAKGIPATTSRYAYSNAKRYSILILDDEIDVTNVLKKGLEKQAPFTVHAFNDPDAALKSTAQNRYDLMIVDIRLPKMDGFEFCEKALQKTDAKVVFITASHKYYEEYQKRFPQWDGNCFVLKPISISVLTQFLIAELGATRAELEPFN